MSKKILVLFFAVIVLFPLTLRAEEFKLPGEGEGARIKFPNGAVAIIFDNHFFHKNKWAPFNPPVHIENCDVDRTKKQLIVECLNYRSPAKISTFSIELQKLFIGFLAELNK